MYRSRFCCISRGLLNTVQLKEIPVCRNVRCIQHLVTTGRYHIQNQSLKCQTSLIHSDTTLYAKGKNKPKKASGTMMEDEEISEFVDIASYKEKLDKIVNKLKQDYMEQIVLRTDTGSFEKLPVPTKDGTFPLNQIASIIRKSPSLIVINLNQSLGYVPDVMQSLQKSGMNINPQQDGPTTIFINIPMVSREHREKLAKNAKTLLNQSKEKMSKEYSSFTRQLKKDLAADKKSKIDKRLLHEKTVSLDKATEMMKAKQKELLDN
ncbi:hypothetical protein ACF0H5_021271 [Mactra antiquata]